MLTAADSQAAIDNALKSLDETYGGLVANPNYVNKSFLNDIMKKAQDALKNEGRYNTQDSSWKTMKNTLEQAMYLYEDAAATQDAIDAMVTKLAETYMNIHLLPDEKFLEQLKRLVELTEKMDRNLYSQENLTFIDDTAAHAKKSIKDGVAHKDYRSMISKVDKAINIIHNEKQSSDKNQTTTENTNYKKGTVEEKNQKNSASVKTGDDINTVSWFGLIVLAGGACSVFMKLRKRN